VFLRSADRNVQSASTFGRGGGTVRGAEILLRNEIASLSAMYSTVDFSGNEGIGGAGSVRELGANLGFGPRELTFEGGYRRRALGASFSDQYENLIHMGARSSIDLGPSGLVAGFALGASGRKDSVSHTTNEFKVVGWVAQTGLLYQAPRGLPFYASLSYRYERIRSNRNVAPIRHEEISGIVLGIGLRSASRKKSTEPAPK
jgi:hypothetical protein